MHSSFPSPFRECQAQPSKCTRLYDKLPLKRNIEPHVHRVGMMEIPRSAQKRQSTCTVQIFCSFTFQTRECCLSCTIHAKERPVYVYRDTVARSNHYHLFILCMLIPHFGGFVQVTERVPSSHTCVHLDVHKQPNRALYYSFCTALVTILCWHFRSVTPYV